MSLAGNHAFACHEAEGVPDRVGVHPIADGLEYDVTAVSSTRESDSRLS